MANPISTSDETKAPLLPLSEPSNVGRSESFRSLVFTRNNAFIVLGPLLCTMICLWVKLEGPASSRNMLGVMAWMFAWWLTEAVPMPVTSMTPLFLFPLFGIASADEVAQSYMDDVIALVLGSFILALAVEHYNIHRRLALNVSSLFFHLLFHHSLSLSFFCSDSNLKSFVFFHNPISIFRACISYFDTRNIFTAENALSNVFLSKLISFVC